MRESVAGLHHQTWTDGLLAQEEPQSLRDREVQCAAESSRCFFRCSVLCGRPCCRALRVNGESGNNHSLIRDGKSRIGTRPVSMNCASSRLHVENASESTGPPVVKAFDSANPLDFTAENVGVIALDRRGCVLLANPMGSAELEAGTTLSTVTDKLQAANPLAARGFRALLDSALASPPVNADTREAAPAGAVEHDAHALDVLVNPFPSFLEWRLGERPTFIVLFQRHHDGGKWLRHAWLRFAFGLTTAEIRTAVRLMEGASLREIAQQNSLSMHGRRYELACILKKVGAGGTEEMVTALRQQFGWQMVLPSQQ